VFCCNYNSTVRGRSGKGLSVGRDRRSTITEPTPMAIRRGNPLWPLLTVPMASTVRVPRIIIATHHVFALYCTVPPTVLSLRRVSTVYMYIPTASQTQGLIIRRGSSRQCNLARAILGRVLDRARRGKFRGKGLSHPVIVVRNQRGGRS
jgi:hypothetical protein